MNATLKAPNARIDTLANLLLIRYAIPNATPKKVCEDVGKLLRSEPLAASEFDETRAELTSAGFLSKRPRGTFSLTDVGRQRALQFLELSELPPRLNWGTVVAKLLFPMATGLSVEAAAKLDTGDRLSAYILKRKYGLTGSVGSSVNQVVEAIACKELGFPEETTLAGLMQAVLSKSMGADHRLTKKDLVTQLPLFETGLKRAQAADARSKLVRDWLTEAEVPLGERGPTEPFDVAAFASTVQALAIGSPPEDRFHDNKVFIAPLWRSSQRETNFPRLSLTEFKQSLIEANSRHLLHLSRADLVQEMDPRLVTESETTHLNATFHFVLLMGDSQ